MLQREVRTMDKDLMKAFGIDFKIEKIDIKGIKVYMKVSRKFYKAVSDEITFLIVEVSNKDKFGAVALKKQLDEYKKITGMEVAFYFEKIKKVQRDALIDKKISFIAKNMQIYLPFIGVVFQNRFIKEKNISSEKMMPITQCLFLYLLYNKKKEHLLKYQIAQRLNTTKMSITRAAEQLKKMNLIKEETIKNRTYIITVANGLELYNMAKKYMINPIQKTICIDKNDLIEKGVLSSESALSKKSMLNESQVERVAVYKNNNKIKQIKQIDPQWYNEEKILYLELWKYEPTLFSKNDLVDPISLSKILEENEDERLEAALEEYMEEFEW